MRAGVGWLDRRRTGVTAACLLLAACGTPFKLPPLPEPGPAVAATGPAPPSAASAPPRSAAESGSAATAVAQPVPARPVPPLVVAATPSLAAGPAVPAAVAAHFPEPALTFASPAFEPGREAMTRDDELRSILFGLERNATIGERGSEIKVLALGSSQSGRPIEAIAFTRPAPAAALAASGVAATGARRPAVVVMAGQHGDEPAGTEALIVVAQELASGRLGVLDRIDVILVPRANPDGADASTRVAANGTDVNRDHLLLRTPEARSLTRLIAERAPVVVLDLHEYPVDAALWTSRFGAVQRFDVLFQYATAANLPPFITKAAEEWFRAPLVTGLGIAGFSIDWYHTVSADPADRRVSMGAAAPQLGRNAHGLTNAVSLLVETRGGGIGRTDFKRRVQAQLTAVGNVLGSAASRAADLAKLRQFVDRDVAAAACKGEAVIEAGLTASEYALPMLDPQTGAIRRVTVTWDSALELRALKTRPRPCGYWLAPSETEAVRKLRLLGIEVVQLDAAGEMRGETYRETSREPAAGPGNGPRLRVQTQPVLIDVPVGSFFVSLEQPLANLAIAVLEPESPAGYVANGVIGGVGGVARVLARPDLRATAVP